MMNGIQIGVSDSGPVRVSLRILNRHGLIAGATGTGKTKTMQSIIEQLSAAGVSVFAPDLKGDLSGLAAPGEVADAQAFPVQFWSLTGVNGTQIRTSVESFGPVLLAKVLGLNDTQGGVLALAFAYAAEHKLPLNTLADATHAVRKLGAKDEYVSKATVGVILRELTLLAQAGGNELFGARNFRVTDLVERKGMINLLSLQDVQDRPRIFSTFLLWLLTQLHKELPEIGDVAQPKLVFFFDEAHLIFADAPKLLVEQLERTVRLIRSKGVGVFFVTQAATDLPPSVLGQLGNRVQHALRAFTPDDERVLKATARTFPKAGFDIQEAITTMGIGQAVVSVLSETGVPGEPKIVQIRTPQSRMGTLAVEYRQAALAVEEAPEIETVVEDCDIADVTVVQETLAVAAARMLPGLKELQVIFLTFLTFSVNLVFSALLGRNFRRGSAA